MKIQEEPIKIREIEDLPAELYSPQNKLIGTIKNQLQFNDIRLQIASQKLEGYYIMFKGFKIKINSVGKCIPYYDRLFDINNNQEIKLLKFRIHGRPKTT